MNTATAKKRTPRILPEGWDYPQLRELATIKYGKNLPMKNLAESGYPVFGANGVIGYHNRYLYEEPQVLISCRGAYSGKINWSPASCFVTNNSLVLEVPNGQEELKRYLFYALQATDKSKLVSGTAQPQVTINNAEVLQIPLAPKNQRKAIVAEIEKQFSRLDEAVANLKRVKANLKRYKAAVLKAAVEGKLTEEWRKGHPDVEPASEVLKRILAERRAKWNGKGKYKEPVGPAAAELPPLPDSWVWTTTGHLCDCIVPNRDKPKSFSGKVPWITFPDFEESSIDLYKSNTGLGLTREEIDRYKARLIPSGSVVMSCVGRFGIAGVCQTPLVINQQLHGFLIPNGLNNRYFAYSIKTQVPYMDSIATATTIRYLNKANCNRVPIPLPPKSEQDEIVMEVERRLSINEELATEIDANFKRATRLRDSILKLAFSGKPWVHNLNSCLTPHQQG